MKTLVYLALGNAKYINEALFSIHTALLHGATSDEISILVYSDTPSAFAGLPVETKSLTPELIQEWCGPQQFILRMKLLALHEALVERRSPCIYVDGDTYFQKPPVKLFRRLDRGHSLMHVREGHLSSWSVDALGEYFAHGRKLTTDGDDPWRISPDTPMWNAGVVGLHHADAGLLPQALRLTDVVYSATRSWISEQFSVYCSLSRATRVHESYDVVEHYHSSPRRNDFHAALAAAFREHAGKSPLDRARAMYSLRPVTPWKERVSLELRRAAKKTGVFPKGYAGGWAPMWLRNDADHHPDGGA